MADRFQTFLFTAIALYHWHSYSNNRRPIMGHRQEIQAKNLVWTLEHSNIQGLVETQFRNWAYDWYVLKKKKNIVPFKSQKICF